MHGENVWLVYPSLAGVQSNNFHRTGTKQVRGCRSTIWPQMLGVQALLCKSSMISDAYNGVFACRGWCTPPSWICNENGAAYDSSSGRAFHAAASVQHSLYVFGGRQTRNQQSTSFLPFIQESELFQQIDEATLGLQTIRPAEGCVGPSPRSHFTFIPWRSRYLITFGGQVHTC